MKKIFATVAFEDSTEVFCFQSKLEAIECLEELQEKDSQLRYVIYFDYFEESKNDKKSIPTK